MKKPQFEDTPSGLAKKWKNEFSLGRKFLRKWQDDGTKVVKKFLDERANIEEGSGDRRLNLFYANVSLLQSMLYGSVPKIEISRTFTDPNDDVARVAGVMATRLLEQDIEDAGEDFTSVLRAALQDRLLPGMGTARLLYRFEASVREIPPQIDPETGATLAEGYSEEFISDEWVDTEYVFWKDILYSPARTYSKITWKAFRSYLNYDELVSRFGEEIADSIPLTAKGPGVDDSTAEAESEQQAEVWEIWDKVRRKVDWYVEDMDHVIDTKDDPLLLDQFFPDPPPLVANVTTSKFVPRSDYVMAQDLYLDIDELQTRISCLTEACKLVGVYDKNNEGVKRIFDEGAENELIPVDNWALLAEKGGLKGVIDWVPLEAVVKTIDVLSVKLNEKIQQLYQLTGMSDILRGAAQQYEAAATSRVKAQFASIKIQSMQDEFARFASDLQSLKMEIIQKHFQPQSIIKQSNILFTPDAQYAAQSVQLLKNRDVVRWRIKIRPESLSMADYAQLKADRVDYINGISTFLQSAKPLLEIDKKSAPVLLELLKWGLAGFKGSAEIEGVMDQAISMYTKIAQQPEQPKPDPQLAKIQAEMQLAQQEHQAKMQQEAAKMENERREFLLKMRTELVRVRAELQQDRERHAMEMQQLREKHNLEMEKLRVGVVAEEKKAEIKMEVADHAAAIQMESQNAQARGNSTN